MTVSQRISLVNFVRGLSRDELECLAEFEGACVLEEQGTNKYRLLADFIDSIAARWMNQDEKAHKTFILLEYLNLLDVPKIRVVLNG